MGEHDPKMNVSARGTDAIRQQGRRASNHFVQVVYNGHLRRVP